MIRINLSGTGTKKIDVARAAEAGSKSRLPYLLVFLVLATAGGGLWWYQSLSAATADLALRIDDAVRLQASLEKVIQETKVYEQRKKMLENRVMVIEDLKDHQVSPVRPLDVLSGAIDRTDFVWLSSLDQNNAIFSMSGTVNSLDALANFVSNLEATGYFKNVNPVSAQEKDPQGNLSFSMTCEFSLLGSLEQQSFGQKGN